MECGLRRLRVVSRLGLPPGTAEPYRRILKRMSEDEIILALIVAGVFILLLFIIVYNALKEWKRQQFEAEKLLEKLPSTKNKEED